EVPQADGLPEQPNQPASTDQQSCGADQPNVSPLGEGAVQVAASKDAGPVRGPDTRRRLERLGTPNGTRGRSLKTRPTRQGATPSQTSTTSSCVIVWWRSVRSLDRSVPIGRRVPDDSRVFRQHGRQRLLDRGNYPLVVAHEARRALHHHGAVANGARERDLQRDQTVSRGGRSAVRGQAFQRH